MVDLLSGVNKLYVDANILIYLLESEAAVRECLHRLFHAVAEHDIVLVTNEITLLSVWSGLFAPTIRL